MVTGRRKNTRIKDWERQDIIALRATGATIEHIAKTVDRSVNAVAAVLAEDKWYAESDKYISWHMQATEAAAANGDAKPAMDMLDRLGLVPETSQQRTRLKVAEIGAPGDGNIRRPPRQSIRIGIAVAGLPPSEPESVKQLTVSSEKDDIVLDSGHMADSKI